MAEEIERQSIELDIEIDKGSTLDLELTWRSGDGELDPNRPSQWPPLVDTTGMTAEFRVRPVGANDATTDFVIPNDRITLGGTTGTIKFSILGSESVVFPWERATYNLLMTDTASKPKLLAHGKVKAYATLQGVTASP